MCILFRPKQELSFNPHFNADEDYPDFLPGASFFRHFPRA